MSWKGASLDPDFRGGGVSSSGSYDIVSNAGIRSGDAVTVYYTGDGQIDRIVKGTPKGVRIDLEAVPPDEAPGGDMVILGSYYWISNQLYHPGNPHDTGPVKHCNQVYYHVYISSGC